MVPAGEGSPCELSSVLLSSLVIADIFMESLALPAECSVSLTEFKSSGGSEGETSRSMRSPVQVL